MDIEFERINLPDGQWVEIRATVTRRMRKKFKAAAIKGFLTGSNGTQLGDLSDPDTLKAYIMAHPDRWDLDAVDDAYLLEGISAWNWPGLITLEAIDAKPAGTMETVLARMRALYAEPDEVVLKN